MYVIRRNRTHYIAMEYGNHKLVKDINNAYKFFVPSMVHTFLNRLRTEYYLNDILEIITVSK